MSESAKSAALPKVRIATTSLAGCFGCHTSFLDIDERIFELAKIAEFDRSPFTDIKHCGPCDIALIEGGVCNAENVQVLRELRANAKILVAIGACAITGGLPCELRMESYPKFHNERGANGPHWLPRVRVHRG